MRHVPAIVLSQLGQMPSLQSVALQDPGPNEVLVRMAASGICHTDIGYMRYARACPVILGHEGAGVVEQVGSGITHVRPGDHVVINWLPKCGRCRWCRRGRQDLCENVLTTGQPRAFWHGQPLNVMLSAGTFSPYVVVPGDGAVRIPADVPLDKAALLGCAVATGVGAALWTAHIQPGEDVVVLGAGGVGLCVVQGARLGLAGRIIAVDLQTVRLEAASALGATHVIDASVDDAVTGVRELTGGRGVEHVFEVTGLPRTMQQGIDMLSRGGALTLIGAADREAVLPFEPRRFMSQQQIIRSCIYGNIQPHIHLPLLADWYLAGRLQLDRLHTGTVSLEAVPEIFARHGDQTGIRTVIAF
jgi:S-(hydroxymethyl)glutathione dehydrogenase / alcohol dehydrogenase